jgi:NADH-quinone oxidoreductase subunit N
MNTPFLWIFLPAILGIFFLPIRNARLLAITSGILCLVLAVIAIFLPLDSTLVIRTFTIKLTTSFEILGRRLVLLNSDRAWLALIYAASAGWFMASFLVGVARRLVPLGLIITALLVAALAVEPFLYAALLLEVAVLLSVPLLSPPGHTPGKGILRFLLFQTIAMPFILFSGWLLAGVEANPGDLILVGRSAILLGLGFALLLAAFPFYTWIPLLSEEAHPYIAGFILWIMPTVTLFFGIGFLDRYAWLRDAAVLPDILTTVGIVMIFSGGLFSAFQRHLGRIMGYSVMMETGFSLVSLGLGGVFGLNALLLLSIPRAIALALWSFSLSSLMEANSSLELETIRGAGRKMPFTAVGVLVACLSLTGLPLLASFPPHYAIWDNLARHSIPLAAWVLAGSFGMAFSSYRMMKALASSEENATWQNSEPTRNRFLTIVACISLLVIGILPSLPAAFWQNLPPLFGQVGR